MLVYGAGLRGGKKLSILSYKLNATVECVTRTKRVFAFQLEQAAGDTMAAVMCVCGSYFKFYKKIKENR